MARHTTYPQSSDFDRLLRASGLKNVTTDVDALNALTTSFDDYLLAAIDDWEKATNYLPFLAKSGTDADDNPIGLTTTRYYTPPGSSDEGRGDGYGWGSGVQGGGRILELDGGLVGLTSVTTNGTWADDGTFTPGWTRTLNRDFTPFPENAIARGKPVTWLEFRAPLRGGYQSIAIAGVWGYCASAPTNWVATPDIGLPGQAFRAILHGALLQAQPDIEALVGRRLLSWTEAGTSEKYRDNPAEQTFGSAQTLWDTQVDAFHLDLLGF